LIKKQSIAIAARRLGIKLSTAKLIIKKFKEDGTYFERKEDKIIRLENMQENITPIIQTLTPMFLQYDYCYGIAPFLLPFQNMLFNPN